MSDTHAEDFSAARALVDEYTDIEAKMASAATDPVALRKLGRRYAELGQTVAAYRDWDSLRQDLADTRELAEADADFAAEIPALQAAEAQAADKLRKLLIPRDPDDARDVIIEVKAGEGGEESALFAGDLVRMYTRYAERMGWSTEVLSSTDSDLGGFKDIQVAIKAKAPLMSPPKACGRT